ncbi:hypothetical protein LTR95_000566 [Oleoguttula sp. CCFEE 5521]
MSEAVSLAQLRHPKASFLDLPRELRDSIYELIISPLAQDESYTTDWSQPSITQASRQIRLETLASFYSNTNFRIEISSDVPPKPLQDLRRAQTWVRAIRDEHVRCMRKVSLTASPPHLLHEYPIELVLDISETGRVECHDEELDDERALNHWPLDQRVNNLIASISRRPWSREAFLAALETVVPVM